MAMTALSSMPDPLPSPFDLDQRPVVAVFRSPVFNASETFVSAQAASLRAFQALVLGLEAKGHVPPALAGTFSEMDEAARRLARRIVTLLESRDLALAESIETDDDRLDDLHSDTFTAMLGGEWAGTPQQTVDVTLMGRYYERFGDHGEAIARRMLFLVTGAFETTEA